MKTAGKQFIIQENAVGILKKNLARKIILYACTYKHTNISCRYIYVYIFNLKSVAISAMQYATLAGSVVALMPQIACYPQAYTHPHKTLTCRHSHSPALTHTHSLAALTSSPKRIFDYSHSHSLRFHISQHSHQIEKQSHPFWRGWKGVRKGGGVRLVAL